MPNRKTHITAGVAAGLIASLLTAQEDTGAGQFAEVLGGIVGGYLGGRAPDLLDPPLHPCHRDLAHGGLAVVALVLTGLDEWREMCRRADRECVARAANCPPGSSLATNLLLQGLVHRFLAGFATGLKAGYASHLALDFCTPRGLPLIGR